jgi:hypothetical protein
LRILVTAYLTAWHNQSNTSEKNSLLNGHISTIQEYKANRTNDFDVLIGIQSFFFNVKVDENKCKENFFFILNMYKLFS